MVLYWRILTIGNMASWDKQNICLRCRTAVSEMVGFLRHVLFIGLVSGKSNPENTIFPVDIPWNLSNDHHLTWISHPLIKIPLSDPFTNILPEVFTNFNLDFPMDFSRFTIFPWIFHGFPMDFPWVLPGCPGPVAVYNPRRAGGHATLDPRRAVAADLFEINWIGTNTTIFGNL